MTFDSPAAWLLLVGCAIVFALGFIGGKSR